MSPPELALAGGAAGALAAVAGTLGLSALGVLTTKVALAAAGAGTGAVAGGILTTRIFSNIKQLINHPNLFCLIPSVQRST
jgi:predicted anti-sigma-YlaC factor YlaD